MAKQVLQNLDYEITVRYSGDLLPQPDNVKHAVAECWKDFTKVQGKTWSNGEILTIGQVNVTPTGIEYVMDLVDFAYLKASAVAKNPVVNAYHPCYVAGAGAIVETADNYLVLGEMAPHTSWAGKIALVGGGITTQDVEPETGLVDLQGNVIRETKEEIGLDPEKGHFSEISQKYVTKALDENNKPIDHLTVYYHLKSTLDKKQLLEAFKENNAQIIDRGEKPELVKLYFLENNIEYIQSFDRENGHRASGYHFEPVLMHHVLQYPV